MPISSIATLIRRIRKNHGLEHATIALLLDAGARTPIGGNATANGFYVHGRATTEQIAEAANTALQRMRGGEPELAVSPYCGTNLAVSGFVAGAITALLAGRARRTSTRMSATALGAVAAALLSRPLGAAIQRKFTTSAEVDDLTIVKVAQLKGGSFTIHRVSTRAAA